MDLRLLTPTEIDTLQLHGCHCSSWEKVKVEDPFFPQRYRNVTFVGDIILRSSDATACDSLIYDAGIYNATIVDCIIGRNTHIANVGDKIANCSIDDNVVIRNVGTISCGHDSTFGNGIEIDVLSESGGREVPMYDKLTAQQAWIIAMARHDMDLVNKLKDNIKQYAESQKKCRTTIGQGVQIINTRHIDTVNIMPQATINGASRLVNGTIGHSSFIGSDVIASNFIMAQNSIVDSVARLDHVFVGEGSRVANGFTAHHSLIFSNCILENGEAAALFAGPYTVSMHKATLLIGAMTSMFNAGSGANQSNHLYKSGPCHHGIFERGVKLASDSYVMWPAHIGAFSTVMGQIKSHPDTSSLPFSYVVENDDTTFVIPAITIGNIGVERDINKWPQRDKRSENSADIINFEHINPYIAQRIIEGLDLLDNLRATQPNAKIYHCNGFCIKKSHAERAIMLYDKALRHYLIGKLLQRIIDNLSIKKDVNYSTENWIDIAGMIAPTKMLSNSEFSIHEWDSLYREYEWNWVATKLDELYFIEPVKLSPDYCRHLLLKWKEMDDFFFKLICDDAEKEFDFNNSNISVGFGQAGDKISDFRNVRGDFNDSAIQVLINNRKSRSEEFVKKGFAATNFPPPLFDY